MKSRKSCSYRIMFFQCLIYISHLPLSRTFFNIARLFETHIAFCRCHSPPARSSRNEEKLLSKSWTTHVPPLCRSCSFPIERVDTIHVVDHAVRTEQWASSWETFRAILTVHVSLLPLRDFSVSWNKDRRSPITDKTTRDDTKSRKKMHN